MVDYFQITKTITNIGLNRIVVAIVIILAGFLIGRFLSNLTSKLLRELKTNKVLKENLGLRYPLEEFLSKFVYYLILFVALITALTQLGLSMIILYIVLIVVLLIIVGLILLAFKDFIPNVIASFWIHQKKIVEKGEEVEIKDIKGRVEEITLTEVKIKTKNNEIVLIPNSLLFKEKVKKLKK